LWFGVPDVSGKHCVQELYRANSAKLNDEAYLRTALAAAAEASNATLLDIRTHAFEPQGVTGFALLAESHISIHTWPEHGYAAVDVFTCGDTTDPERACSYLAEALEARSQHVITLDRYLPELSKT
jgi:S-adenosylmethionine decarboxylase